MHLKRARVSGRSDADDPFRAWPRGDPQCIAPEFLVKGLGRWSRRKGAVLTRPQYAGAASSLTSNTHQYLPEATSVTSQCALCYTRVLTRLAVSDGQKWQLIRRKALRILERIRSTWHASGGRMWDWMTNTVPIQQWNVCWSSEPVNGLLVRRAGIRECLCEGCRQSDEMNTPVWHPSG